MTPTPAGPAGAPRGRARSTTAVWTAVVALFAGFAVAVPVVMVRDRAGSKPAGAPTTGGDREVVMARLAFSPTRIAVPRGARVVFLNKDVAPHTVTGDSGPLDSGILGPGRRYELVVDQPLAYHCAVHPAMKARIDLEG